MSCETPASNDPRRRGATRAALSGLLLAVAGCGVPGDTGVRVVDDAAVPYRLLESETPSGPPVSEGPVRDSAPVVFWVLEDDRLAPAAAPGSCAGSPEDVVERLLEVLQAGPGDAAREAGRSTAVPPSSRVGLVDVTDGVATVSLDPATPITADRLPLAVGQVVLSVTSAPGVREVRVRAAGEDVQLPLPGGALTSDPVSPDDYADLVLDRYRDGGVQAHISADIGCTGDGTSPR